MTSPAPTTSASTSAIPAGAGGRGFRPEIQGLRAVAVGLVLLYHLWPNRLPGGFVGVDVFFVISGFLITAHLVKDAERGRVDLVRFWGRRIRRLLPASLLVLLAIAAMAAIWLPPDGWSATVRQLVASAFYVQNWALAADAVDYLAMGDTATMAQHFWSLSVEEQFYVLWPLLIVAALAARRRWWQGRGVRGVLTPVIAAVLVISLVISVWWTATDAAWAYFATPTRIWELAIGALLAVTGLSVPTRVSRWLGWVGLVVIGASAFLITGATPFPGAAALAPTLGAAAVIVAGQTGAWFGADRALGLRPARFLGDISYSVYLWHWPLVVIVPYAQEDTLGWLDRLAILALTLVLAFGTKVLVEDRFRTGRLTSRGAPFRFAAVGMAIVLGLGLGLHTALDVRGDQAESAAAAAADSPCWGPGALTAENCGEDVIGDVEAALSTFVRDDQDSDFLDCRDLLDSGEVTTCELGSSSADPERVIAVIGDSFATMWLDALDEVGRQRGWSFVVRTKAACPTTVAERSLPGEPSERAGLCQDWLEDALAAVAADDRIDAVLTTAHSSSYGYAAVASPLVTDEQALAADPAVQGYVQAWQPWVDRGLDVYVVPSVPLVAERAPTCLATHSDDPMACTSARDDALPADPLVAAADEVGASVVDLSSAFCDSSRCYPMVGGVIAYYDGTHVSRGFSLLLAPRLGDALAGVSADRDG